MRKMKDSGIEWIGQIPEEWTLSKIGAVYEERNEKVSDKDYAPLSVTKQGIVPQLETAAKTDNGDNRKLIKKNDFAINSRSDRRGSCGISEFDGSCSLINTVLKPRKNMCNNYYNYVFHSDLFSDEFYRWGNGIVNDLWSTKWSEMKRIYIPYPSLAVQSRIADYLDEKCGAIDRYIEKQKQVIEKLKAYKQAIITQAVTKGLNPDAPMKDSGIEWIGQIPMEWGMSRIKYVSIFQPNCDTSKLTENTEITYTPMEYIKNGYYINNTLPYGSLPASLTPYNEGDIVIAKVTPCFENGNIAIMNNISSGFGLGSSELFVIRPNLILTKYLYYWLQNELFKHQGCATMTGTGGLKRVSAYFMKNCPVTFPDMNEQEKIVSYLDNKTKKIDLLIEKKEKYLLSLDAYKKSLIYETVTGKKKV